MAGSRGGFVGCIGLAFLDEAFWASIYCVGIGIL